MIGVGQYRVRFRTSVRGLATDQLSDWAFGSLDRLLEDAVVVQADVAGALARGEVEYDLHVRAETVVDALRLAGEALGRATATGSRQPRIDHAEVDRVAVPA